MPQLSDLFESLEQQLDLPAEPIPLQNHDGGILILRKRREHHNVLSVDEGFWLQLRPVFAGFALELLDGLGNGGLALPHHTYPSLDGCLILKGHAHLPSGNLSGALDSLEFFQQGKLIALLGMQNNALGIEPNGHPGSPRSYVVDACGLTIATVHKNQVSGANRELPQGFSGPFALGGRQSKVVASQSGPLQTVMDTPLASRRAG